MALSTEFPDRGSNQTGNANRVQLVYQPDLCVTDADAEVIYHVSVQTFTCAGLVGLVFIAPTIICSITNPSLGDTTIILAFKLIIRTAMIDCKREGSKFSSSYVYFNYGYKTISVIVMLCSNKYLSICH